MKTAYQTYVLYVCVCILLGFFCIRWCLFWYPKLSYLQEGGGRREGGGRGGVGVEDTYIYYVRWLFSFPSKATALVRASGPAKGLRFISSTHASFLTLSPPKQEMGVCVSLSCVCACVCLFVFVCGVCLCVVCVCVCMCMCMCVCVCVCVCGGGGKVNLGGYGKDHVCLLNIQVRIGTTYNSVFLGRSLSLLPPSLSLSISLLPLSLSLSLSLSLFLSLSLSCVFHNVVVM